MDYWILSKISDVALIEAAVTKIRSSKYILSVMGLSYTMLFICISNKIILDKKITRETKIRK